MIGQTLGRYRVLARIGAGGMGEVYRARDEQLERDVAVKVLPGSGFSDAEARRRLLREARAAAALNHPHVCTIHEVGEADGQVFIAMELIEGQRLDRLIPPGGLPVEAVLRHGLQMADAVAHAHERGIVHRDLKTSNTLVTLEGRVKVLDFGLAKRVGGEVLTGAVTESSPLTDTGAVVGTVPYMSPELLSGQPADTRSDWSVLAHALLEAGHFGEGARAFERWAELTGRDKTAARRLADAAAAYARNGEPQRVPIDVTSSYSASIRMLLGRDEEALEILEKASADGAFAMLMNMRSPAFDRVRAQPSFRALWSKAGLPPLPERR